VKVAFQNMYCMNLMLKIHAYDIKQHHGRLAEVLRKDRLREAGEDIPGLQRRMLNLCLATCLESAAVASDAVTDASNVAQGFLVDGLSSDYEAEYLVAVRRVGWMLRPKQGLEMASEVANDVRVAHIASSLDELQKAIADTATISAKDAAGKPVDSLKPCQLLMRFHAHGKIIIEGAEQVVHEYEAVLELNAATERHTATLTSVLQRLADEEAEYGQTITCVNDWYTVYQWWHAVTPLEFDQMESYLPSELQQVRDLNEKALEGLTRFLFTVWASDFALPPDGSTIPTITLEKLERHKVDFSSMVDACKCLVAAKDDPEDGNATDVQSLLLVDVWH
jgi:hypothetical protein